MNFIPVRKLNELLNASKNGDSKAKAIIDKYMEDSPDMDSIARLLDEYYANPTIDDIAKGNGEPTSFSKDGEDDAELESKKEDPNSSFDPDDPAFDMSFGKGEGEDDEPAIPMAKENEAEPTPSAGTEKEAKEPLLPTDAFSDLDKEFDGLIDTGEVDGIDFSDYLKNKKHDSLVSKKNKDYFKAFDPEKRKEYLDNKLSEYSDSFKAKRRGIGRKLSDMDGAIGKYSEIVIDMPDDEVGIDLDKASKSYDDFTGNEDTMASFGRSWDEEDMKSMKIALQTLVDAYGKKNVMAMLNTLRDDCRAWGDYCNGKFDLAIDKYGKSMADLLK